MTTPATYNHSPSIKPVPRHWQVAGRLLRTLFHFGPRLRGRWALYNLLGRSLRGQGYTTTIRFDRETQITLHLDDWIPYQIFLTGFYAIEELQTRFIRSLLHADDVLLDIGANIGYYTLQAATRVGPNGKIHAFEPVQRTFDQLAHNIKLNNFQNVAANRQIVHDHQGQMAILVSDPSKTGIANVVSNPHEQAERVEYVPTTTIDSYLEQQRVQRVDLIKIDVEGSELAVLKGMAGLLASAAPQVLVELSDETLREHGASAAEVLDYMQAHGFNPYKITPAGPRAPAAHELQQEDLILFRKERGATQRSGG